MLTTLITLFTSSFSVSDQEIFDAVQKYNTYRQTVVEPSLQQSNSTQTKPYSGMNPRAKELLKTRIEKDYPITNNCRHIYLNEHTSPSKALSSIFFLLEDCDKTPTFLETKTPYSQKEDGNPSKKVLISHGWIIAKGQEGWEIFKEYYNTARNSFCNGPIMANQKVLVHGLEKKGEEVACHLLNDTLFFQNLEKTKKEKSVDWSLVVANDYLEENNFLLQASFNEKEFESVILSSRGILLMMGAPIPSIQQGIKDTCLSKIDLRHNLFLIEPTFPNLNKNQTKVHLTTPSYIEIITKKIKANQQGANNNQIIQQGEKHSDSQSLVAQNQ